jgi:ubiquinone/menaquinone biosynthesis C-methylase UbiE
VGPNEDSAAPEPGPAVVFARIWDLQRSAEVFALLLAAQRGGLIRLLATPTSSEVVGSRLRVASSRVDAVLEMLEAHGIVERSDGLWALSSAWEPLVTRRSAWDPAAVLTMGGVRVHQIEGCLDQSADYWSIDPADRLAVATGISPNPEHAAEMVRSDLDGLDGVNEALDAGGRVLELGCGVGSRITALMLAYPTATAVGVELADDLADYGRERATRLGVSDRLRFVVGDATTYRPEGTFDLVGWSQFFFPETSRFGALTTARRALRPGGWITAPTLWDGAGPEPGSEAHRRLAAERLRLDLAGVPMKSADEVAEEMKRVGFTEVGVEPSVGRWFVHGRQP